MIYPGLGPSSEKKILPFHSYFPSLRSTKNDTGVGVGGLEDHGGGAVEGA
jgi:hypothetical protein